MTKTLPNTMPSLAAFEQAVLEVLADQKKRDFDSICKATANQLQLTPKLLNEKLSGGAKRHQSHTLKVLKALVSRGLVKQSKKKKSYYLDPPQPETSKSKPQPNKQPTPQLQTPASTAQQKILTLLETHQQELAAQLRKRLQASDPVFFEKLVLELLWAMGYGGAQGQRIHTGGTNDHGLDGVIWQDPLGIYKIYLQAKRQIDKNPVRRPVIQQFYGALASRGADRGVFITSSRFSDKARKEAQAYKVITLIDGEELTRLMIKYRVGVRPDPRPLELLTIDEDYFKA